MPTSTTETGSLDFDFERIELNGNDDLLIVGEGVGQGTSDLGMSNGRAGERRLPGCSRSLLAAAMMMCMSTTYPQRMMLDLGYAAEHAEGAINYNDVDINDNVDTGETTSHGNDRLSRS